MDLVAAYQYATQSLKEKWTNNFAAPKVTGPVEGVNVMIVSKDIPDAHGDVTYLPTRSKAEDPTFSLR